jgi:hypothetical protein
VLKPLALTIFPMLNAINLVFSPAKTWERIALANRNVLWVLGLYLLPCLLVGLGTEYYGLTQWGERRLEFESHSTITPETALKYVILHAGADLLSVFLAAWFLHTIAQSFNVPSNYAQAFNALAYAMGPLFLLHALDALPAVNTWVPWAIGVALSAKLLYHGVALCLKPEQTKGFGLFIVSVIMVILLSGLVRFAGVNVLRGRVWKAPLPAFSMLS